MSTKYHTALQRIRIVIESSVFLTTFDQGRNVLRAWENKTEAARYALMLRAEDLPLGKPTELRMTVRRGRRRNGFRPTAPLLLASELLIMFISIFSLFSPHHNVKSVSPVPTHVFAGYHFILQGEWRGAGACSAGARAAATDYKQT